MKKIAKALLAAAVLIFAAVMLCTFAFAADAEIKIKAENTDAGIKVIWTEVENVYYYELYRQSNDGNEEVLLSKAQGTEFTDTEATPGTIYGYKVVPVMINNDAVSESKLAIVYCLRSPRITNSYSSEKGLYIEWEKLPEAKGYYVFRRNEGNPKWKAIAKISAENNTYTDSEANTENKNSYAVRAFAGEYLGGASNQVTLNYFGCPKVIGVVGTTDGIAFKWKNVSGTKYYIIYRRDNSASASFKPYALLDSQYTYYEDKDIKKGVSYSYIVRATAHSGQLSPYDPAFSMKSLEKPVILSAESAAKGVKLTWTKSAGCQGYAVYRKDYGTENWALACLVKGENTLAALDTKVINAKAYTYIVRAVWDKNLSTYDEKGATVRFLEAPQNLLCDVDTANGNVLTWKKNPSANTFFIYRKPAQGKWKAIGITKDNFFADKKANPKEKYDYTVQAYTGSAFRSAAATPVPTYALPYTSETKMVALTYDDGPGGSVTDGILDLLEEYGGKATFFVLGQNIDYSNEVMTRAAKMGCEIGSHTYSHIDLPSSSESEIREEIQLTDALVKKYTGSPTKVARAPGGALDEASGQIVGKPFFYWSIDTRDWESRDPSSIIDIVQSNVEDGDIILMHDIYDTTLTASEYIIPWLVSEGYKLVTVSELMHYKSGAKLKPGATYVNGFSAAQ